MIYFDQAATSFPKPKEVLDAVYDAMLFYGANPGRSGHQLSVETARKVYQVRESVANFFDAEGPEQVVFTQNCTHALNLAIHGLLKPGDHVILSDLEHNSVLRPVHTMAQQGMITYSIAKTVPEDPAGTIEAFRQQIHPNTKAIFCTHGSNAFGIRMPVEELAKLAHRYGLMILVDAAQTAGTLPIQLRRDGIDFLCTAGHKGLYGPSGTGLLVTPHGENLTPWMQGGTGSLSADYNQPAMMPDRLESGTLNTAGILGLGAGVDFLHTYGEGELYQEEIKLLQAIYEPLSQVKAVQFYTPMPQIGVSLPVLSLNLAGQHSEQTAKMLDQAGFAVRGGLQCAPLAHEKMGTLKQGTVRISVGAFNTLEQAEQLVKEMIRLVRSL